MYRSESIKFRTLMTEIRNLKTYVASLRIADVSHDRLKSIFSHTDLKNTQKSINMRQVRAFTSLDDNEDDLMNCREGGKENRVTNEPGKSYCASFPYRQTVQLVQYLFETNDLFFFALTNMLRVLGCRPSSLKTMKFDKGVKALTLSSNICGAFERNIPKTKYTANVCCDDGRCESFVVSDDELCTNLDDSIWGVLYECT